MMKAKSMRHDRMSLKGKRAFSLAKITAINISKANWRSEREQAAIDTLIEAFHANDMGRVERMLDNNTFRSLLSRQIVVVKREQNTL